MALNPESLSTEDWSMILVAIRYIVDNRKSLAGEWTRKEIDQLNRISEKLRAAMCSNQNVGN